MNLDTVYHIARVSYPGIAAQRLVAPLKETSTPAIRAAGGGVWGIFTGLLGLDTRELYLVTTWPAGSKQSETVAACSGRANNNRAKAGSFMPPI